PHGPEAQVGSDDLRAEVIWPSAHQQYDRRKAERRVGDPNVDGEAGQWHGVLRDAQRPKQAEVGAASCGTGMAGSDVGRVERQDTEAQRLVGSAGIGEPLEPRTKREAEGRASEGRPAVEKPAAVVVGTTAHRL